ncbi:transposase, partial [Candidatus Entotheonella palauensis]|uniref:transposase n=1 Tax=Candidatus Entotheonella palauensis TaxID=93172 RepID=UPI0015C4732E
FPGVVAPYARRTERRTEQLQEVAFALGGEAGARLLKSLGMPTSPDTLIRLICRAPELERVTPRVLGVDDWAKKKGLSYGTILVDLEAHCVVDLLDERSAESLSEWLQAHPGVEIISRDRGNEYIKGATEGAPEAIQVADRWHLLKNLREALERLLTEKPACLRAAAQQPEPEDEGENEPDADCGEGVDVSFDTQLEPLTQAERQKPARHNRKQERRTLHKEGLSMREIGRQLHMSYRTISKYLQADSCPFYPEQIKRGQSKVILM